MKLFPNSHLYKKVSEVLMKSFCPRFDFESNISTSFHKLREDNEFFDVTLCCDNDVDLVQAHEVILAVCSPYYAPHPAKLFDFTNFFFQMDNIVRNRHFLAPGGTTSRRTYVQVSANYVKITNFRCDAVTMASSWFKSTK